MRIQYGPNPTMGPICRASGSGYCVGLKMIGVQVLVVCLDLALLIACVCLAHASIVRLSWHCPVNALPGKRQRTNTSSPSKHMHANHTEQKIDWQQNGGSGGGCIFIRGRGIAYSCHAHIATAQRSRRWECRKFRISPHVQTSLRKGKTQRVYGAGGRGTKGEGNRSTPQWCALLVQRSSVSCPR